MKKAIISFLFIAILIGSAFILFKNVNIKTSTHAIASTENEEKIPLGEVHEISIKDNRFSENPLAIAKGDVIIWINDDEIICVLTSKENLFSSQSLNKGDIFNYRFLKTGKYEYYCKYNPSTKGIIIVE